MKKLKMKQKNKKGGLLSMLLGTSGASLLGNMLTGKRVEAKIPERGVIRASEETVRTSQSFYYCHIL